MSHRMVAGRLLLDRTGLADRFGVVPGTVSSWYARRDTTGFPEPVPIEGEGPRRWWDAVAADAWWSGHQAANRSRFTPVDRSGDPDDLLDATAVARILHYRTHRCLPPGLLALAEQDHEPTPNGRAGRCWRRGTVWAYADWRSFAANAGRPRRRPQHIRPDS